MKYRDLGDTGIKVSEIAFGAEFLVERPYEDTEELIKACEANGINFVDCWMSELDVRSHLGKAIKGNRENWVIQGHIVKWIRLFLHLKILWNDSRLTLLISV